MKKAEYRRMMRERPRRYYMFYKPSGCVSARKDEEHKTVMDYFPETDRETMFPVGRLDRFTTGLMIITDDGKLNKQLLSPESHIEKEYEFWAAGEVSEEAIAQVCKGVYLKGLPNPTKPCKFEVLKIRTLGEIEDEVFPLRQALIRDNPEAPAFYARMVLTEGKRHQVKRMMEAIGCVVLTLRRTSMGNIVLDEALAPGTYRALTDEEEKMLKGDGF